MDSQEQIQRAEEARFLLEQPLLKEALEVIETATIQKWEMAESKEARDDLWRFYKASKLFRQYLQSYIETGKMAQLRMLEDEKSGIFKKWRTG